MFLLTKCRPPGLLGIFHQDHERFLGLFHDGRRQRQCRCKAKDSGLTVGRKEKEKEKGGTEQKEKGKKKNKKKIKKCCQHTQTHRHTDRQPSNTRYTVVVVQLLAENEG